MYISPNIRSIACNNPIVIKVRYLPKNFSTSVNSLSEPSSKALTLTVVKATNNKEPTHNARLE